MKNLEKIQEVIEGLQNLSKGDTQEANRIATQLADSLKSQGATTEVVEVSNLCRKALSRFKRGFIRDSFQYKQVTFGQEDLNFLYILKSAEVNPAEGNRAKSNDNTFRLLRCMQQGEWFPEVLDIHIDTSGKLKNGQHTIDALYQHLSHAECPDYATITLGFKLGVNPDSMPYLDSCRPRSIHQNLTINHNGNDIGVNKHMKDVIKLATKEKIHQSDPMGYGGTSKAVNFFEMKEVVNEHEGILHALFTGSKFPRRDWNGGIRYMLFKLALVNLDLATQLSQDIRDVHEDNWSEDDDSRPESEYCDHVQEHDLIEHCRSKKYSDKFQARNYLTFNFYEDSVEWVLETYPEVKPETFSFSE